MNYFLHATKYDFCWIFTFYYLLWRSKKFKVFLKAILSCVFFCFAWKHRQRGFLAIKPYHKAKHITRTASCLKNIAKESYFIAQVRCIYWQDSVDILETKCETLEEAPC